MFVFGCVLFYIFGIVHYHCGVSKIKKINFYLQGCIKLIKSEKDIYNVKIYKKYILSVLFNFVFIKES